MLSSVLMWLGVALVAFLIEVFTVSLVSLWFVAGALVAAGLAAIGQPFILQLAAFVFVSFRMIVFCERRVRSFFRKEKPVATNSDRLIGQTGTVTSPIDAQDGGRVIVNGMDWKAVSAARQPIARGQTIRVLNISGVKLEVVPETREEIS